MAVMLVSFPLFIVIELANRIGLLLDDLLFAGYRKIQVSKPVFIVGVPRSGTTFFQRLLAKDKGRFSSMKLWEVLFAPSVTQKKIFLALGWIDGIIEHPLKKMILAIEKRRFANLEKLHKLSLFESEEDDPILLHIFSSPFLCFMFPFTDDFKDMIEFDTEVPADRKKRIMAFYMRCVQNHLYVFGPEKIFLSKNPAFTPKIRSLYETFPDAKIICPVRSPLSAAPSAISMLSFFYNSFNSSLEPYPLSDNTLSMIEKWYQYPPVAFEGIDRANHITVLYDDLVGDPGKLVHKVYERFDFDLSEEYGLILLQESEKAKNYKSRHGYTLEQFGLTHQKVVEQYEEVFDRYGFEK